MRKAVVDIGGDGDPDIVVAENPVYFSSRTWQRSAERP